MFLIFELVKNDNQINALITAEEQKKNENENELDIACKVAKKIFENMPKQVSWVNASVNTEKLKERGILVKTAADLTELTEMVERVSKNLNKDYIFVVAGVQKDELEYLQVRMAGGSAADARSIWQKSNQW